MLNKPTCCVYMDQNNMFFRYRKLDFAKLLVKIKERYDVIRATSYMAIDGRQESQKKFITYLANNGWKCFTIDISVNTNVDGVLMTDMMNDYQERKPDCIVLISGDGDYSYTLDMLSKKGAKTHVIGAKDYVSLELLKVADTIDYMEIAYPEVIVEAATS